MSLYLDKVRQYTNIALPPYKTLLKAHNKAETLKIAREVGVPTPKTYTPKNRLEVINLSKKVQYPVIIKRRKGSGLYKGVRLARTPSELVKKYVEIENMQGDHLIEEQKLPLIQEYVPGEIRDVCVLFNRGEPRAALVQRRIWTWPPKGGVGILNETVKDDKTLKLALKLLKKMKWHGVAQVEFKKDEHGNPLLMEVNPKFWGTLELSIKAGINFPLLIIEMMKRGDIPAKFKYKVGIRFYWPLPYITKYLIVTKNKKREIFNFLKNVLNFPSYNDIEIKDIGPECIKAIATFYILFKLFKGRDN